MPKAAVKVGDTGVLVNEFETIEVVDNQEGEQPAYPHHQEAARTHGSSE